MENSSESSSQASSTIPNTSPSLSIVSPIPNIPFTMTQPTIYVSNQYAPIPNQVIPTLSLFQSLTPLTLKLDRTNYSFWKTQVIPALRAHNLEGFILGTNVCPPRFNNTTGVLNEPKQVNLAFSLWVRTDQSIMSWLIKPLFEMIIGHVVRCSTSHQV